MWCILMTCASKQQLEFVGNHGLDRQPVQNPITSAVVCTEVLIMQIEEELNAVQGNFGFQRAIKNPGEGIEWQNEHAH